METLKERDLRLEALWDQFADIPMDLDTEEMCEPFLHFPAGTHREIIWKWFDERYSVGVAGLLYRDGRDRTPEIATLAFRRACCFDCDSETCVFNPEGVCMYPLVYGKKPEISEDLGCRGFIYKEG